MNDTARRTGGPAPGDHLALLIARARNPFDLSERLTVRLAAAVRCDVQLRSFRQHRNPPPALRCSTYQYTFTFADHSVLVLWELRHVMDTDGEVTCEVYPDFAALQEAESRVHQRMGDAAPEAGDPGAGPVAAGGDGAACPPVPVHLAAPVSHGYTEENSADHARRLLRRAVNPDRPGARTRTLLDTAVGHHISRVAQRFGPAGPNAFCSVYEHAFLLADGREVTLYELEHDFTTDGRLVCEVYADAETAGRAAQHHVTVHGTGGGTGE
ncbi:MULTISPECIES: DUF6227 family protein [unclassified Streptomyces]|uniref:DUF6227 family protein n=1 Tax=unclassified Streptomyces TaxID=2593676 RepID=UPI0022B70495|nr:MULTISPECIES: DUF6227 family protein [unclassified Streptomyces]MCZ7415752.1 DUF6227 family protein [Streptomyces sp. WMMC897]MCZ7434437.1 DUF6227 family protein [Streptomyces sp. WMMC1477]